MLQIIKVMKRGEKTFLKLLIKRETDEENNGRSYLINIFHHASKILQPISFVYLRNHISNDRKNILKITYKREIR